MLITRLRNRECRELLTRLGFGRLACVSNNRPYIVPIYFSYDADCLYCFSDAGTEDRMDARESAGLRGG